MSVVHEDWSLCRYAFDACFITGYALCMVSLLTLTAISVDRLLALSLGLRYRQVETLRRLHVAAICWAVSGVTAVCRILAPSITLWFSYIGVLSCLVLSVASYTKMFLALRRHQTQVQDDVQQQTSQSNALNMARYRKAVYSALWAQLALVVCYLPHRIVSLFVTSHG